MFLLDILFLLGMKILHFFYSIVLLIIKRSFGSTLCKSINNRFSPAPIGMQQFQKDLLNTALGQGASNTGYFPYAGRLRCPPNLYNVLVLVRL